MNDHIFKAMSKSASDFTSITWPVASNFPLIGGGSIKPVEAIATNGFKDDLDLLAGIDAWQVNCGAPMIRGLASRIQWYKRYNTFSIRFRLPSGQPTEFNKRLISISNKQHGHLFPYITVQAYLSKPGGKLLSCAAIATENLFEAASILVDSGALEANRHPRLYGTQTLKNGTTFIYLHWNYLLHKKMLAQHDIFISDT